MSRITIDIPEGSHLHCSFGGGAQPSARERLRELFSSPELLARARADCQQLMTEHPAEAAVRMQLVLVLVQLGEIPPNAHALLFLPAPPPP